VKEASSELVKRDQSLDVASENSMQMGSAYASMGGRTFLLAPLIEVWLVELEAISGLVSVEGSKPAYWLLGLLCTGLEGFEAFAMQFLADSGTCCWKALSVYDL
jgi:hypothetical protein